MLTPGETQADSGPMASKNNDYDGFDYEFHKRMTNKLRYPDIRNLYYTMIFPLLEYKPMRMSADAWIEMMWDVYNNPIKKFTVGEGVKVPGAYWIEWDKRQRGYGDRGIRKDSVVYCRFDIKHRMVDVEALIHSKNKHCTFTLNLVEWKEFSKKIEEME